MNATAALPIEGGESVADCCKKKIRAMLAPYMAPARRVERGAALWGLLTDRERAFLCKAARVDAVLVASDWSALPETARVDLLAAWQRFADWVRQTEARLDRTERGL